MSPLVLLCALALALAPQDGAEGGLEVTSQGGLFVARLAKAQGQERVPDAIARWKLSVLDTDGREQWSCFHPAPQAGERHLLSEDGAVFVTLHPQWSDSRAVVTLRAGEGQPTQVFGGELGLSREALRGADPAGTWLAQTEAPARFAWIPGPFGPHQVLELDCVDGATHRLDLASGLPLDAGGGQVEVRVEPPFEDETVPPSRVPPVERFSAPDHVAGDEPLVVRIEGAHPNPGWNVFAFGLEPTGDDGRTLLITPRARPPMPGGLVVQQIEPYVAEARIVGLPPGTWKVQVKGRDGPAGAPLPVEVTPGGVLAVLHTTGGFLGLDQTLTLYENGVVEIDRNRPERHGMSFAPPRAFATARMLLSRLAPVSPGVSATGSDMLQYVLRWRRPEGWHEILADDGTLRGELRTTIEALGTLVQP